MKFPLHSSLLLMLAFPATTLAAGAFVQSPAYKECTQLASSNPPLALQKAEAWLHIDSGTAALHCRAMALYGLHRYAEAATALTDVRGTIPKEDIVLRSYVARQTSRAWLNAQRPDAGIQSLTDQIDEMALMTGDNATEAKLTADLLLDRARLRVSYGQLPDAIQDLDHAVSLSPINADVLLERSKVFEQIGDAALAKQDLQAVLRGDPTNAEALDRMRKLRNAPAKKS